MANKPNNPALWSRAKSMAKQKFDVYPSAYANGWAAKWYKGKGGTWRKAEYGMEVMGDGGTPDNPGFRALPVEVQRQIMDNMAQGGQKMPPEIARARFAAAGNLDQMADYGYAYGGYIPEMMYGGKNYMQEGGEQDQVMQLIQMYAQMAEIDPQELMQQLQQMSPEEQEQAVQEMVQTLEQASQQQQQPQADMTQAAMKYGGYMTGMFAEGGEPNGSMLMGQMAAVSDKMNKLRQFVSPEQNLDPWIASKLAVIDDSTGAIADYMMYNPDAEYGADEMEMFEQAEMMQQMAEGGYTVTRSSDRKGKTHKVTGPDGSVKYFGDSKLGQHPKDPKRKAAFYARHKKNLDGNPHFRAFARKTWKEGGSTFSGNAFYEDGGEPQSENYPDYASYRADLYRYNAAQAKDSADQSFQQMSANPLSNIVQVASNMIEQQAAAAPSVAQQPARTIDYNGVSVVDLLKSAGKASDYNSRKELASKIGIDNYYGSAKQNMDLIKKITKNPSVLDDYQSAMPSRSGSTSVSRASGNTIKTTKRNPDGSVETTERLDPVTESMRMLQEQQDSISSRSGMMSNAMSMNRPNQTSIGPASTPLSFFDRTDEYDDSYMLDKIGNDPNSPGNVRKRKQIQFAKNMGMAASMVLPFLSTVKYLPMLRGLPQFMNAASKPARALPQAAKALPKPAPTNFVTNSGMSFKMGGPVEGEVLDVTEDQLEALRQQGYQFEMM